MSEILDRIVELDRQMSPIPRLEFSTAQGLGCYHVVIRLVKSQKIQKLWIVETPSAVEAENLIVELKSGKHSENSGYKTFEISCTDYAQKEISCNPLPLMLSSFTKLENFNFRFKSFYNV